MKPLVIVIAGVTGAGKTELSLRVARELGGEIVSADSMQIYKGMDIGTAKILPAEMQGIPHHMLDIAEPYESFSVAEYVTAAAECCDAVIARGRVPVITGGTGLYIDSLLRGTDFPSLPDNPGLRKELEAEYDRLGGAEMRKRLAEFDPERAEKLNDGDRRRIVRAIEVFSATGVSASELDRRSREAEPRYRALYFVLAPGSREVMYDRINRRVDSMLEKGLVDEVRGLLTSLDDPDCTAMQAIGYKETAQAIKGEFSLEEAVEVIKLGSRRYAKRQLTWFRRREDAVWLRTEDGTEKNMELICEKYRESLNREGDINV